MDANRSGTLMPAPETELLQLSQRPALRASSDADLRRLVVLLATACDAARVAALRNMPAPARQADDDSDIDRNCGFAGLYDALRRARAEIKRRDKATHQTTATASGKATNPGHHDALTRAFATGPRTRP